MDLNATQNEKIRKLQKFINDKNNKDNLPLIEYISVNFNKFNEIPNLLQNNGFDFNQKTVFILEGVAPYIPKQSVEANFELVSKYSGFYLCLMYLCKFLFFKFVICFCLYNL